MAREIRSVLKKQKSCVFLTHVSKVGSTCGPNTFVKNCMNYFKFILFMQYIHLLVKILTIQLSEGLSVLSSATVLSSSSYRYLFGISFSMCSHI